MDLKEIAQFLDDNAPAFLATLGTCGNPKIMLLSGGACIFICGFA